MCIRDRYHKGTNDYMYNDFLPPENTKTFTGLLVSIEWWHQKGKYALICNFKKEDRMEKEEKDIRFIEQELASGLYKRFMIKGMRAWAGKKLSLIHILAAIYGARLDRKMFWEVDAGRQYLR